MKHETNLAWLVPAVWLLLIVAAIKLGDCANTIKRRERWRSIMAGLVGLGSTIRRNR